MILNVIYYKSCQNAIIVSGAPSSMREVLYVMHEVYIL